MDQINNGMYRAEVVATEAGPSAIVVMPGHLRDVTLQAKGGGAGANKVQYTLSSLQAIKAGTAEWIDVNGLTTLTNTGFTDATTVTVGQRTVTAYRAVYADADTTLVVLGKPA